MIPDSQLSAVGAQSDCAKKACVATFCRAATSPRMVAGFILCAACAALAMALVAEYVFGLMPCPLCIMQRVGFLAVGLGCVPIVFLARSPLSPRARTIVVSFFVLTALAALTTAGIAVFQVGVEEHWWQSSCSSTPLDAPLERTLADLRADLLEKPFVSCENVQWRFLGLSIATWSIPFALMLDSLALWGAIVTVRKKLFSCDAINA